MEYSRSTILVPKTQSTELLSLCHRIKYTNILYCIVEIIPNKYPTNELLRRNKVGDSLVDKIPDTLMPRGAATWQGKLSDE